VCVVLGFERRVLQFARQVLYHLNHSASPSPLKIHLKFSSVAHIIRPLSSSLHLLSLYFPWSSKCHLTGLLAVLGLATLFLSQYFHTCFPLSEMLSPTSSCDQFPHNIQLSAHHLFGGSFSDSLSNLVLIPKLPVSHFVLFHITHPELESFVKLFTLQDKLSEDSSYLCWFIAEFST
jgi:hypothetical protein